MIDRFCTNLVVGKQNDNRKSPVDLPLQNSHSKLQHVQKIEALNIEADISETKAIYKHDQSLKTTGFMSALRASVRPVITYLFFTLFAVIKGTAIYGLIYTDGVVWEMAIQTLWDEETQGIFAAIISFWFGSRALQRSRSSS